MNFPCGSFQCLFIMMFTSVCEGMFKCRFGTPKEATGGSCSDDYMLVTRREEGMEDGPVSWEGCCPKGKGPCDEEKQEVDDYEGMADFMIPKCDDEGYFKPYHCADYYCYCITPKGEYLINEDGEEDFPDEKDCFKKLKEELGSCDAGKWGHSCHKSCDCDDCDRLNGKCGGGGDGDKKKGADKKGVSGSNSVHMKNYGLVLGVALLVGFLLFNR